MFEGIVGWHLFAVVVETVWGLAHALCNTEFLHEASMSVAVVVFVDHFLLILLLACFGEFFKNEVSKLANGIYKSSLQESL